MYFIILFFCGQPVVSQETKENEIKEIISLFFKGLQSGDTLTIKQTISNALLLQTTYTNKEGKSILRTEDVSKFLNSVALKKPEDIWEEKLLSYYIQIDGNMANVWTPYEFYLNNDFSHCGVNSFQLFFNGEQWRIIYLIDTRRKQDCKK
jgi:hypothetical protein